MKKLLVTILINFAIGAAIEGLDKGLENRSNGKTFFGKERKRTSIDWKGNVVLGSKDYKIEAAC